MSVSNFSWTIQFLKWPLCTNLDVQIILLMFFMCWEEYGLIFIPLLQTAEKVRFFSLIEFLPTQVCGSATVEGLEGPCSLSQFYYYYALRCRRVTLEEASSVSRAGQTINCSWGLAVCFPREGETPLWLDRENHPYPNPNPQRRQSGCGSSLNPLHRYLEYAMKSLSGCLW